jgi:hypothetical protein
VQIKKSCKLVKGIEEKGVKHDGYTTRAECTHIVRTEVLT